jgi:hypothetical protein
MKIAIVATLVAAVVGCGSKTASVDSGAGGASGDGAAGACRANSPVGASVSWVEDGVAKCAVTVIAQRSTQGTDQLLQLQGVTLDGASAAFAVVAYSRELEGTHSCSVGTPAGAPLGTPGTVYADFVRPGTKQECSVTITAGGVVGGANATGTFSAVFTGSRGAVVTSGVFDTPVKGPPS